MSSVTKDSNRLPGLRGDCPKLDYTVETGKNQITGVMGQQGTPIEIGPLGAVAPADHWPQAQRMPEMR